MRTKINAPIPNAAPIPAIHFNNSLPSSVKNKKYKATAPTPIQNNTLTIIHKTTAVIGC